MVDEMIKGSATFDGLTFRPQLDRWWSEEPRALVCMANPSTAGAYKNDPTIYSLIRLCRPLPGCGGFTVVNAEDYIATDPADLPSVKALETRRFINITCIRALSKTALIRIVAWGNLVPATPHSRAVLAALSRDGEYPLYAFGTTRSGNPKHPMARGRSRIADGTVPIIWEG